MSKIAEWLGGAERWLDARGKPAWIVAMALGLIVAWPIGLVILGYMIWSGRMNCNWSNKRRRTPVGTGNTAFDAYRDATLARLEEERAAFADYLEKLRHAKDKAEFDGFMAERSGGGQTA